RGTGEYGLAPGTFIQARGGLDATFRGRLGVAADRALFYVTGGAIVANIAADVSRPTTNFFGTKTGTQWG
uniref:hypothetical protein n=1 Tax=Klebsiella pneumoniae TaxID=573 RepID=UPI001953ADCB